MSSEESVREVLEAQFGNAVFTVEEEMVWVSGMNGQCVTLARKMARSLANNHSIPTGLVHDDGAAQRGGVQFKWGESA